MVLTPVFDFGSMRLFTLSFGIRGMCGGWGYQYTAFFFRKACAV